jgi:penicillin-binding protein 2
MRSQKLSRSYDHEIEDAVLTASEREAARMSFDFDRRWLMIFWSIAFFLIIFLIGRVFYICVVKGEYYGYVASGNSIREIPIIAPRGKIFDANGEILADNVPSRNIIVQPEMLSSDQNERDHMVEKLTEVVGIDFLQVRTIVDTAYTEKKPSVIIENITHEQALAFRTHESDFPGIQIQQTAIRNYPHGMKFAHVIGYEGLIKKEEYLAHKDYLLTDHIGKTGIEYEYEQFLHGKHGAQKALVDSRGNIVKDLVDTKPIHGAEVHLNIDAQLQRFLYDRLLQELDRAKTDRAAAIILDPRDGAVRALVSLPSYDNNKFAQGIDSHTYNEWITDDDQPLFNRAIAGVYAPGSTVKPVMGIAVLGEKIISPDRKIESTGGLQLGSFFFGDWRVHGFTDIRQAIAVSSDVYFYTIGGGYGDIAGLGIEKMKEYMQRFGYGKKTGIDLPGEVAGVYPDKQWKEDVIGEKWYIGNTYHASIGQGFITATTLQVAQSIVPIANGGTIYTPRIVSHIIDAESQKRIDIFPEIQEKDIAPINDIKIIQEGMRQTVTDGTATFLKGLNVAVAGKTGTAEFGVDDTVHSWFVSYAPYDDSPEMVMVIMVEGQSGDISSSTVPVAHDVYKWYFDDEKMAPDELILNE